MQTLPTGCLVIASFLVTSTNRSSAEDQIHPASPANLASGPQDDAADLAKKLQNPIAAMISVPVQNNFDSGGGPDGDGWQYKMNIQPVIPITLNDDWNIISRTIMPVIWQDDIIEDTNQCGLGDTLQSFFFSPQQPTGSGWIWGAGPVFLLPTASADLLGNSQWGAGPTAVMLKQQKGWTVGMLANQVWSFAGETTHPDVNSTFLQPFVSYTTQQQTTFTINSESTHDWANEQWTVPLNFMVAQLVKIGSTPIQFQTGLRYYAERPGNGPDWGLRFTVTWLFPK